MYSLFLALLVLLSVSQPANCQTCYWPNGEDSGYKQCSSNGGACCYSLDDAHHDPCFSNGLCQSLFFGYIYRGACTDSKWGPSCPNVCTNVDDDQVTLRFCSPWDGYCCQNSTSTTDCCAAGVGFEWNNATWTNYQFTPQQDNFKFNLTDAYPTTSAAITLSTAVKSAKPASVSGTASACTSVEPMNTTTCSNSLTVATGAGLGVGLGVPLVLALAALLWLAARRRYEQRPTTARVASGSSKPKLHDHSWVVDSAYNGAYRESSAKGLTGRGELPGETGHGRAELGTGERL